MLKCQGLPPANAAASEWERIISYYS